MLHYRPIAQPPPTVPHLSQAGVRDGITRGVGTVRRTGAWAVREGAGRIIPPSSAPADRSSTTTTTTTTATTATTAAATFDAVVFDDPTTQRAHRRGGSRGSGEVQVQVKAPVESDGGDGDGDGGGGVEGDDGVEESDEDKLLVALKTAEVCVCVGGGVTVPRECVRVRLNLWL